jgi:hypothetical protein
MLEFGSPRVASAAVNRERRLGQNEVWFRGVNERLERRALGQRPGEEAFEIVCECDREECTVRIPVSYPDYESVRATGTQFIVAPGHADLSLERIVLRTDAFEVVAKLGDAAVVASEDDPRT